jgi:nitrite reductase/ring-hydroxylating ferredoxin subunit
VKVVVAKVSEIADGERRIVDVNGKSVGIFRRGNTFYAIRNRCPHQFGPLCVGALAPRPVSAGPGDFGIDPGPPLLACPWHGWEYDIETGQSFMGPGLGHVAARRYDVSVVAGSELQDSAATDEVEPDEYGRVPGPYKAEMVPVYVEEDYVIVED